MSFCIMILVAGSSLYLQPVNKSGVVASFVDNFTLVITVVIFSCIGIMCLMALCGLMHHAAMGGKADFAVFNLGRTPETKIVAEKLKEMSELLARMEMKEMEQAFDALAVYDTRQITTFMTMMSAEVLVDRKDFSYGLRVSSSSLSSDRKSVRSRDSLRSEVAAEVAIV